MKQKKLGQDEFWYQFICWDWKGQPDMDDLTRAINTCVKEFGKVYLMYVDTEDDQYCIAVTPKLPSKGEQKLLNDLYYYPEVGYGGEVFKKHQAENDIKQAKGDNEKQLEDREEVEGPLTKRQLEDLYQSHKCRYLRFSDNTPQAVLEKKLLRMIKEAK